MKLTDPAYVSALAAMLDVTVRKCRIVWTAARNRTPDDVAAQLRHVVRVCVKDTARIDEIERELGIEPPDRPAPERVVEFEPPEPEAEQEQATAPTQTRYDIPGPPDVWETPPPMSKALLIDIRSTCLENLLADREEYWNASAKRLVQEIESRGLGGTRLTRAQMVDLIVWLDYQDAKKVARRIENTKRRRR
jgi:hypothetical protein